MNEKELLEDILKSIDIAEFEILYNSPGSSFCTDADRLEYEEQRLYIKNLINEKEKE